MTDTRTLIERAEAVKAAAARSRVCCNDTVIALRITSRILAIDLMTGQWSNDPLWPDTGNHVIPFRRGRS